MTPDEMIPSSVERCQRRGSSSSAAKIGLAKASPTIAITLTFSRSIVSRSSTGSNRRDSSVTTEPPTDSIPMELNAPVPCMSGQAGQVDRPGTLHGLAHAVEAVVFGHPHDVAAVQPAEQVVLAPHDALRHPGGSTGVKEVEVVAAATPRCTGPARSRSHGASRRRWPSSGTGPIRRRPTTSRAPSASPERRRSTSLGEAPVEHDARGVGVVPQVVELVVAVAVVGVHRHHARLQDPECRLEVLGAVRQVVGDLVLLTEPEIEQGPARCRRRGGPSPPR